MRDFKKINAYKMADQLVLDIYQATNAFPHHEIYGLTSQLRRAAASIPSNIAEGASRQHKKDYLQFLYVARGSLAEVEYLLSLSRRLNYIVETQFQEISELRKNLAMTLYGLINSVKVKYSPAVIGLWSLVFGL